MKWECIHYNVKCVFTVSKQYRPTDQSWIRDDYCLLVKDAYTVFVFEQRNTRQTCQKIACTNASCHFIISCGDKSVDSTRNRWQKCPKETVIVFYLCSIFENDMTKADPFFSKWLRRFDQCITDFNQYRRQQSPISCDSNDTNCPNDFAKSLQSGLSASATSSQHGKLFIAAEMPSKQQGICVMYNSNTHSCMPYLIYSVWVHMLMIWLLILQLQENRNSWLAFEGIVSYRVCLSY